MHAPPPSFPVLRLATVRVAQSTVGLLIALIGSAGVPVVALAMLGAGVVLGVTQTRSWTPAHGHALLTGTVLAAATAGHTLAVLNAPLATVETVVLAGALLPLVADPVQRRRPRVVLLVVACVATGGLLVGFAGGSLLGIALAVATAVCAALLVIRFANAPAVISRRQYQSVSITFGGMCLLPVGLLLGAPPWSTDALVVIGMLTIVFAVTNLELGKVLPETGAVIGMASSGLRPVAALFLGAAFVDQPLAAASVLLACTYAAALAGLVRAVKAPVMHQLVVAE